MVCARYSWSIEYVADLPYSVLMGFFESAKKRERETKEENLQNTMFVSWRIDMLMAQEGDQVSFKDYLLRFGIGDETPKYVEKQMSAKEVTKSIYKMFGAE